MRTLQHCALGPAGRIFSIGVPTPKMVPMGSVSDTYSPMPVSKSAGETPVKCPKIANPSALLGSAPPSCPAQLGCGRHREILSPFGARPNAAQLGLGAGRTEFFNSGFPAENGANGVRFGYGPRKNVGMTQNPQPFWRSVPAAAAAQWGCRRNRKILSPFGTCPMPAQLGLGAGQTKIFNRVFGTQNGANGVRFGYGPRKNVGMTQNPQPSVCP